MVVLQSRGPLDGFGPLSIWDEGVGQQWLSTTTITNWPTDGLFCKICINVEAISNLYWSSKCMCISVAGWTKANLPKYIVKKIHFRNLEKKFRTYRIIFDKQYNLLQCYTQLPYGVLTIICTRWGAQFNSVSVHFHWGGLSWAQPFKHAYHC